jgi:hypothetical protein
MQMHHCRWVPAVLCHVLVPQRQQSKLQWQSITTCSPVFQGILIFGCGQMRDVESRLQLAELGSKANENGVASDVASPEMAHKVLVLPFEQQLLALHTLCRHSVPDQPMQA